MLLTEHLIEFLASIQVAFLHLTPPFHSTTLSLYSHHFHVIFQITNTIPTLLGLTRVEQLENGGNGAINSSPSVIHYRGYVTPLQFPGLLVSSVIDFDVEQSGSCLTIECREDAIQVLLLD